MPLKWRCFRPIDPERRASKDIDKMIGSWMKTYNKAIKLLLLGAGESGKTTIIKQMKILHEEGFTNDERSSKAREIRRNLLEAIKEITEQMDKLEPPIQLSSLENRESLDYVQSLDINSLNLDFNEDFYRHIMNLWSDEGVRSCFKRAGEYSLIDSAQYFLDRLDSISRNDYTPDDQDILRCRHRTTDIQKIEFEVKIPFKYGGGSQSFWMFDVGGQRGERRKWIQVFDGITAVLFLVSTSGFDMRLREDNQTNRLRESLNLFEDVWHSRFLQHSGFILFLNKQDLLREKVRRGARLEMYFPEYAEYQTYDDPEDPEFEYKRARQFIRDKFLAITNCSKKSIDGSRKLSYFDDKFAAESQCRQCFWHYTTATDTDNISKVFHDVHTMIIIWNLKKISIT